MQIAYVNDAGLFFRIKSGQLKELMPRVQLPLAGPAPMAELLRCLYAAFPSCRLQIPFVFGFVALTMHADYVSVNRSGYVTNALKYKRTVL